MQTVEFEVDTQKSKVFINNKTTKIELPALWLRERCQSPDSIDPYSQQRFFNPHLLPEDLSITAIQKESPQTLMVRFSDGILSKIEL